jgi:UDP-2,3-diacylglucosamine pyrophosphatase LpxH
VDTLIVSDIHLGLPVSRPRDLLRLLESSRFNRLILLVDVFHDGGFQHLCADTWRLLRHVRALNARRKVEVVWISGNHDRHLAPLLGKLLGIEARESFTWSHGGRAYHALHGDRFDGFVSNHAHLSAVLSWLYAFSLRWFSRQGGWPHRLDRPSNRVRRLSDMVAEGARRFAAASGHRFDVIVCGHTHEPHHRLFDVIGPGGRGVEYFNSGSWLERPASFLSVDALGVTINRCP